MKSSSKKVKDEKKIEKPDNEESIDNSLLHLSKSLYDLNKFSQNSKKEEEVLKNRFIILNLKKSDLEEKIQLTNLDTERIETMNMNLKKTKSIVMDYKKKMELFDLQKKSSLNFTMRKNRDDFLKNWKSKLIKKNKKEAEIVKKEKTLIENIKKKSKEKDFKIKKEKYDSARVLRNLAVKQKKEGELNKKMELKMKMEEKINKKYAQNNQLKIKIENQQKKNKELMNTLQSARNPKKLQKVFPHRQTKTAKNSKKKNEKIGNIDQNIKKLENNKSFTQKKANPKIEEIKTEVKVNKIESEAQNEKEKQKNNELLKEVFERQKKLRENKLEEEEKDKYKYTFSNLNREEENKNELKGEENKIDNFEIKNDDDIMISEMNKNYEYDEKEKEIEIIKEEKEKQKEKIINKKINETLEDMCIYGNVIKKKIEEEKKNESEKFIEADEALKLEEEDQQLFTLGLLSKNLESLGIEAAIEKNENYIENNENNENEASATGLQFLSSGLIKKKKYKLHFDFGKERNEEILNDKTEYEKFKENLKLKISKDYNISTDKIVVTFPERGSVAVQVLFQSDEFNDLDTKEFLEKFKNENDKEFAELKNLKEVHSDVLMEGVKLTKKMLDARGNRSEGWGVGEKRGNMDYDPPIGWIGIGLKVWDMYDDGDNTWIGMSNFEGEWCVAYHGVGRDSNEVKKITGLIIKGQKQKFKVGACQAHRGCKDKFHEGKNVGEGAYCTPTISTAESYSGISTINGVDYKTVIMVRVKPEAIRCCGECDFAKDYWVVNGTSDEIRPYRILYKRVDSKLFN